MTVTNYRKPVQAISLFATNYSTFSVCNGSVCVCVCVCVFSVTRKFKIKSRGVSQVAV
jgi:hypothetical protein